jgi:Rad3-related DNA helicase
VAVANEAEGCQTDAFQPDLQTNSLMQSTIAIMRQIADILDDQASRNLRNRFNNLLDKFNLFLSLPKTYIYQLIMSDRTETISLVATPCDISQQLADNLWSSYIPAILTSGTLAIRGDFTRTKQVLGLSAVNSTRELSEFVVASPFDYQRNCLISCIPGQIVPRSERRHPCSDIGRPVFW